MQFFVLKPIILILTYTATYLFKDTCIYFCCCRSINPPSTRIMHIIMILISQNLICGFCQDLALEPLYFGLELYLDYDAFFMRQIRLLSPHERFPLSLCRALISCIIFTCLWKIYCSWELFNSQHHCHCNHIKSKSNERAI